MLFLNIFFSFKRQEDKGLKILFASQHETGSQKEKKISEKEKKFLSMQLNYLYLHLLAQKNFYEAFNPDEKRYFPALHKNQQ